MKSLSPEALRQISRQTLEYYDRHAGEFWEGTKDHDVRQNYRALLEALPRDRPLDILDFGCGPGRDLLYFKSLGHRVIGVEGSGEFCEMARVLSACEVWQQDFLGLDLPAERFDGIFANASLFHVPSQELPRVLREFWVTLKPSGVLFTSNPRGEGEGWSEGRYATYLQMEPYQKFLQDSGFEVLSHYYRPAGKPREEQPWLAVVSRKVSR